VIIEIESMEVINFKKMRLEGAIKNINKNTTFLDHIRILYYILFKWILNKLYIKYMYSKSYKIKEVGIKSAHVQYKIQQEMTFKINENGVSINGNYIPYEYIIQFYTMYNLVCIQMFGALENVDKKILIKPSNNVIDISVRLDKDSKSAGRNIKKNMYYHIKYNQIDEQAITLFKGDKNC